MIKKAKSSNQKKIYHEKNRDEKINTETKH